MKNKTAIIASVLLATAALTQAGAHTRGPDFQSRSFKSAQTYEQIGIIKAMAKGSHQGAARVGSAAALKQAPLKSMGMGRGEFTATVWNDPRNR